MRMWILFIILLLGVAGMADAKSLELKPFVYEQNFEKQDPVPDQPWAVGAKYALNFKGLTTEKAHSGKQSYKIDVTFDEGRYLYFSIPVSIPVYGKLKFSAYIYVPDDNQGNAGVGVNYAFPPTPTSGCSPINGETFTSTKGEWKLVQGDLVADGKRSASIVTDYMWGISADKLDSIPVGIYIDRIGFYLYGDKGKHIVMYLDDIKIEGEVPDNTVYDTEISNRWSSIKHKIDNKYAAWDEKFTSISNDMATMTGLSGDALDMKNEAQALLKTVKTRLENARTRLYLEKTDQTYIDNSIKKLESLKESIANISSGKIHFDNLRVSVVPPISDNMILPFDSFIPGKITDTISISGCRGEYVPASFVVRPTVDMQAVKPVAGHLRCGKYTIPAASVDIKLVKCWYQAGTAWDGIAQDKLHRVLVPELLLNDGRLVKVDYDKQDNYLRGRFPDGERYIWISDASKSTTDSIIHTPQEYPVEDAASLMPLEIKAKTNQQYWITVKVPASAKVGKYSGKITIADGDKVLGDLKLSFTVLPFNLDPPYYTSSIYYRGILRKGWEQGSISSEFKSEQQLKAELHDMIEHGVDNPTIYQSYADKKLLGRYLEIMRDAGWKGDSIYFLGISVGGFPFTTSQGIEELKAACKDTREFCRQYGVKNIFIYGIDEATGEVLKSQIKAFAAAHEAGVKLFVAGYGGNFDAVGNLLDILVYAGSPTREEARKWHSVNHKVWSYANPQAGPENPAVYRRNFGLLLWKQNFDGACTYAYQHSFGSIWNDFDDITYRDHCIAYPTTNGVIDTIAWEGYREGVTDVRYVTTLMNAIKKAKKSRKASAAKAAQKYLDSIDILNTDPDTVRTQIIKHILQLTDMKRI